MADPESDLLESPSEGQFSPNAPTPLPVGSMAPAPLDYSRPQAPGAMPNALLDRVGPSARVTQQIEQTYGERMAQQDRTQKAMLDRAQAVEQANRGVDEAYAIPRGQVPQRLQLQATPEQRIHEFLAPIDGESPQASISKMINAMGLFAQMGGAVARGHAASGVAALSGALAGWNEGQVERAQLDFRKWEMETRKAIAEKNSEFQQYEAFNNDRKMTIEERLQKSKMVAYEKGNYVLAEQFNLEGYDKALDHLQQERNHLDTVEASTARIMQAAAQAAETKRMHDSTIQHQRETEESRRREIAIKEKEAEAGGGFDDATLNRLAQRYAAGEPIRDLVRGFGKRATVAMIEIQNRAERFMQAAGDPEGAIRLRKANLDANRGALTKITKDEADFNSFLSSFETQLKNTEALFDAAKTSGSPVWNKPALWYRASVNGDTTAKNLLAQMEIMSNEMSRITLRTRGTAEGTRQHHRELLNGSMSPEQFMSLAREVMTKDAESARRGFADAKAQLQGAIGGGGSASAPAAAPPASGAPGAPPVKMRPAEFRGERRMIPADTDISKFPGAKWLN